MGDCRRLSVFLNVLCLVFFVPLFSHAAIYQANPGNLTAMLAKCKPGDTLQLAAGTYTKDLNINKLNGRANAWITITGPSSGPAAIFVARSCCNTVEITHSSYIAIRHLTLDGKGTSAAFGISAKGGKNNRVHHIRVEDCLIKDYNGSQQIVGISTKTPTWGWEIRRNQILRAGTGMYLGNSNGEEPFFDAIIENNLIMHTTGYNMEIKHQNKRPVISGMPSGTHKILLRHNVFIKDDRPSPSGDRPNVLLGGFPTTGAGSNDSSEVYGNLFVRNARESLLQATGRISIHDNLFVDTTGTAITLRTHNTPLRLAHVYNNTVYKAKRGLYLGTRPTEGHLIVGNLFFAQEGMGGLISTQSKIDNIERPVKDAPMYVVSPSTQLGAMDFFPLPGKCEGGPLDLKAFSSNEDWLLDFNGNNKGALRFRGAYASAGTNPGWKPKAGLKSLNKPPKEPPAKETPPLEKKTENTPKELVAERLFEKMADEPGAPRDSIGMDAGHLETHPQVDARPPEGHVEAENVTADRPHNTPETGDERSVVGSDKAPAAGCACVGQMTGEGDGRWLWALCVLLIVCSRKHRTRIDWS